MIVILSMTNLSVPLPGLIAMYLWMDLERTEGGREAIGCLCSMTRGDSSRLAPEEIFPHLVVGMLTSIKTLCLPLLS